MTTRLAIAAAFALCGCVCMAAFTRLDAENVVRRRLVQRGLRQGVDSETGIHAVIASAVAQQPSVCFRVAELRAIHQLLNMRGQSMAGMTEVQRDAASKSARTFVETLSQSDLDGCIVLDFEGRKVGDRYVASVAVGWSDDFANRAQASAAGTIFPAKTWIDEFRAFLDAHRGGMMPSSVSFVDSAGFLHNVGIGTVRLDGDSALQRNTAARMADLLARKNLSLALHGRSEMRKKAELMKSRNRVDDGQALSSVYEALGNVSADGPLPVGSRPLFDMVNLVENERFLSVVYGVDAPISSDTGREAVAEPSGVMIFNPNIGTYEKR